MTGMVVQPLGQVIAWIAWAFLEWTILAVRVTADLPFSSVEIGHFDVLWLALYYAFLFGFTVVNWKDLYGRFSLRPALAGGIVLVAGVWLWNVAITAPDGKTHVLFLDTDGAAAFVQTPGGRRILVDGGASPSALLSALGDEMPFWDRQLDVMVSTRPDERHLSGLLTVLERFEVGLILEGPAPNRSNAAYTKWRDLIAQRNVPTLATDAGQQLVLERDVVLEFLAAGENAPHIPRLRAGALTVVFADGATEEEQSALVDASIDTTGSILVAPQRLTPEFLPAVAPQYVVLFAGRTASDEPPAETLSALSGLTLFRTGEQGTIEMITDGQGLAVRTER